MVLFAVYIYIVVLAMFPLLSSHWYQSCLRAASADMRFAGSGSRSRFARSFNVSLKPQFTALGKTFVAESPSPQSNLGGAHTPVLDEIHRNKEFKKKLTLWWGKKKLTLWWGHNHVSCRPMYVTHQKGALCCQGDLSF